MEDRANASRLLLVMALALFLICLGCCIFGLVWDRFNPWIPYVGTELCAGLTTRPRVQVGIAVLSPLSSYRPPLVDSPYAFCFRIPTSVLPSRVHWIWLFPP
ncbi:MAG: hypothetical protein ACP5GX_00300 [Anaerolineae bacterium]